MNIKGRIVRLLVCLILLGGFPALTAAEQVALTILHTNDTHGHLLPFSYPGLVPAGSELAALPVREDIGGIARRAAMVKRVRAELEPRGTTVWLVDAGDFSDGTAFSTEYHGEADIAAMNAAGYTFGTLGNHEFTNSFATLRRLLGLFQYPVVCANLTETSTGKPLVAESAIRRLGPLKIGIFGLVTQEAKDYPAAKDHVIIADEIATAQRIAATLRHDVDIVIALSHAGELTDERIAAAVPGIDVIVGGHSHTRLPVGALVWHSDDLKPKEVNGTIIVQAHQWGGELGRLDLLFDKDEGGVWRVARYRARLLPITSAVPEDATVAGVVARYWGPIAAHYGEILGQAAGDFTDRGDDMAQYNLVADAIRDTVGTEIEVENMGGVRAPLIKGNITRADLATLDPFDNTVVTFTATGRQLKDLLLQQRPAVSGLRYRIEGGALTDVSVGGQPLDESRTYTGATNSYFAGAALKEIAIATTGKLRRDMLIDYVRKKAVVRPAYDGRRVIFTP